MNPSIAGMRVLVVEDELLVAMVIEDVLESLGCQVVGPAVQLDEALALARDAAIDCALLDINICGGTVEAVVVSLDARGIPVLLTTGYGVLTIPLRLQAYPCLAKPYGVGALGNAIRALCGRVGGTFQ